MTSETQQKDHVAEANQMLAIASEIVGEITVVDELSIFIGLMADGFERTHGREAADDFIVRMTKFMERHPIIPESYTDDDMRRGTDIAKQIRQAWAPAQPPFSVPAFQLAVSKVVNNGWSEIYGPGCAAEWKAMLKAWGTDWRKQ